MTTFEHLRHHETRFFRSPDTGEVRAHCSCGWSFQDRDRETVQARATSHDLDEDQDDT